MEDLLEVQQETLDDIEDAIAERQRVAAWKEHFQRTKDFDDDPDAVLVRPQPAELPTDLEEFDDDLAELPAEDDEGPRRQAIKDRAAEFADMFDNQSEDNADAADPVEDADSECFALIKYVPRADG